MSVCPLAGGGDSLSAARRPHRPGTRVILLFGPAAGGTGDTVVVPVTTGGDQQKTNARD